MCRSNSLHLKTKVRMEIMRDAMNVHSTKTAIKEHFDLIQNSFESFGCCGHLSHQYFPSKQVAGINSNQH